MDPTAKLHDQAPCQAGGAAIACDSRNTKLPELGFHAVLGDGAREVRIKWAPGQARCGR
jgi:hypothetical protein